MESKTYIKYSLVVPVLYVIMAFLNVKFGTTTHEYTSKPLGNLSDFISWVIDNLYIILMITHVVLYFGNEQNKTFKNRLMMIANTILGFLAMLFAYQPLVIVAYAVGFLVGGFVFVIGYIVLYLSQLGELNNIDNN